MSEIPFREPSREPSREQMNIVIVGHVDHGKSTLVGRILADTGSIDPAKIAKVRRICEQQGKHFEYSFLLDALEAEQAQGITIDSARCFFKSQKRDYIIIDAAEGVRENSRRHGYLLSLLGIRQIVVVVNKMDRVGFDPAVFDAIRTAYTDFLAQLGVQPAAFIPVSALEGDLVVERTNRAPWYDGPTVLEAVDAFDKAPPPEARALRLPVQDVYRFNRLGDSRRIIAGRITQGTVRVGDEIQFLPSGKTTRVASIEAFSAPADDSASAGRSTGLTMAEEVYVQRGDIICHPSTAPRVSDRVQANLFWLGRQPLRRGRTYKLKLATYSGLCELERIVEVIDASQLSPAARNDRVERHEVAEVVLRLRKPMACDLSHEAEDTARFVLVDGYDLAGGGIVRDVLDTSGEDATARWTTESGAIDRTLREAKNGHRAFFLAVHDDLDHTGHALAGALEESLWSSHHAVFRLSLEKDDLHKLGGGQLEMKSISFARTAALLNAGQIVIATVPWAEDFTHHEVLQLPGMDTVPRYQIRFASGAGAGQLSGDDWTLDPSEEPRAMHDAIKRLLAEHIRRS